MRHDMPMLGERKSVQICEYLFQTLGNEARRLTPGEVIVFQRLLTERYSVPNSIAESLLALLRRNK